MSSIRHDLHLCIVRTVHLKKTRQCPYDTGLCRETRWRPYDMQEIRLPVVRTVHVAKPDDVQTPLGSVAIPDGLHTTLGFVAKFDGLHTTQCETR